jgi:hypothetical protein
LICQQNRYVGLNTEVLAKEVYHQGRAVPAILLKPPSKSDLRGLADILNPPQNIGRAQFMRGVSSGVHGPTHLANLVGPLLKRRDVPANEASNDILWCQAGIPQLTLNPVEGVDWPYHVLGVICPVLHLKRWLIYIWRQVEQINIRGVLHIEEAFLPLLTWLKQFYLRKVGAFLGHDGGCTTLGHRVILLFLSSFR